MYTRYVQTIWFTCFTVELSLFLLCRLRKIVKTGFDSIQFLVRH